MTVLTLWAQRWALVPVALLLASAGGVIAMATVAADDPGFSLEPKYYEKAVQWDREQAAWANNARLGWRLTAVVEARAQGVELVADLTLPDGTPLGSATVEVECFPNARATEVRHLSLQELAPGKYAVPLGPARSGLWEFRFVVSRDGARFTKVARLEVSGKAAR